MIIKNKLFSRTATFATAIMLILRLFINGQGADASPAVKENFSQTKRLSTASANNGFVMSVTPMPANAGMVNVVPAKQFFGQGEMVQLTAIPTGVNGQFNGNIHIEAETGTLLGNFAIAADSNAAANFYVFGTTGGPKDGSATYIFTVAEAGSYFIWGRCFSFSPDEDSYFFQIDGQDTLTWHLIQNYNVWQWQKVTHNRVEQQFVLAAGQHQIIIIKRDLNVRLDKLILTKNKNFQPQGKQELPTENLAYKFDFWGGDVSGFDNPVSVLMDSDKNVAAYFSIKGDEIVSVPSRPEGPDSGLVGEILSFSTGGAKSTYGDPVAYQFDWGDGQQSTWGDSTATHYYEHIGVYQIKARSRCQIHSEIVSPWSASCLVEIMGAKNIFQLVTEASPENVGKIIVRPAKNLYDQDEQIQLFAVANGINGLKDGNVHIEAETGMATGNFVIAHDSSASAGFYLFGAGGLAKDGAVELPFIIDEAGDYELWGRCYAISPTEDSFFLLMDDNQDTLTWHLVSDYNKWMWQKVNDNRQAKVFYLETGEHKLTLIKRDQNARLDKLIISGDSSFEPVGKEEISLENFYQFDHWLGDLSGSENPKQLTMDGNKTVTAYFRFNGQEVVTAPLSPAGPDSGYVGHELNFSTGGSVCNSGFGIEYQFSWGDGDISEWSGPEQKHAYSMTDIFFIQARARSLSEVQTQSGWSDLHQVVIIEEPIIRYLLQLTIEPPGKGSVLILPDKAEYAPGDTVSLFPTPIAGYYFDHWSGDLSGTNEPGIVILNTNKNITAHFNEIVEVVSAPQAPRGPDSGLVGISMTFSSGGSMCNFGHAIEYQFDWGDSTLSGWGSSSRQHTYSSVDTFKLKAQARCSINQEIISEWSPEHVIHIVQSYYYTLTIYISPENSGSVNKTPYKTAYQNDETVILSALPAPGYIFDGWSGSISGPDNPAFLKMDGNKNITAHFKFLSAVERDENLKPEKFGLWQNFPNPFNPETTISYQLPEDCFVSLTIFNTTGQLIIALVDEFKQAGYYSAKWEARDVFGHRVPSGIYLYQLSTEKFNQVNKMILLK